MTLVCVSHGAGLDSYQKALEGICCQVHSGCWQNPVPCGCRTEISVSLLDASQGLPLATGGLLSSP